MEKFGQSVQSLIGLKLSKEELEKLHEKYRQKGSDEIERSLFLRDLTRHIKTFQEANGIPQPKLRSIEKSCTYPQILAILCEVLSERLPINYDQQSLRKSFQLIGASRTPLLNKTQLRSIFLNRLGVNLCESNISTIFNELDKEKSGTVRTRHLLQSILKTKAQPESASYFLQDSSGRPATAGQSKNEYLSATVTYDNKFVDLVPPVVHLTMTTTDLEKLIGDRIFEKSGLGSTLIQSLVKCFGDTRTKGISQGITLDQMKYSIWKRLQIPASSENIEKLFGQYDSLHTGCVPLYSFVEGIVRKHSQNEPLLTDPRVSSEKTKSTGTFTSSSIPSFLRYLRLKFRDMINRESRAPHALLHGANRMTAAQAKAFFEKKLSVRVSDALVDELSEHYPSSGLIDMRRLLRDAMSVEFIGTNGENLSLIDRGGIVQVETMPASLRGVYRQPGEIEALLHSKMFQRQRNDHPLSYMHQLFHEDGKSVRACGKAGMHRVLQNFDIILTEKEFEEFFSLHDRGDEKIDVRKLLVHLLHRGVPERNAIIPKDSAELKKEYLLSKSMGNVTGRCRVVTNLQGPSFTQFNTEFAGSEPEVQSTLSESAPQSDAVDDQNKFGPAVPLIQQVLTNDFGVGSEYVQRVYSAGSQAMQIRSSNIGATTDSNRDDIKRSKSAWMYKNEEVLSDQDELKQTVFSPIRPSSAQPSRLFAHSGGIESSNTSPRSGASIRPSSANSRSPRARFVKTGQPRGSSIDPNNPFLKMKYSISKKHCATSHEDYGLHVKSFATYSASRKTLEQKLQSSEGF